jgi:hypothetical protein
LNLIIPQHGFANKGFSYRGRDEHLFSPARIADSSCLRIARARKGER